MPKDFLKKYMPDPHKIKDNKSLRFLGPIIHDPNLWHLNRHSVAKAFAIGLFWGCIPMPFQMVAAAFCAMKFRANLPISVALVWFSNPVTMPPIFYVQYLIGSWLLNMPALEFHYELSWTWFKSQLFDIGVPLYFGSLITGVILSLSSYYIIHWLWRLSIVSRWKKRQEERSKEI